MVYLSRHLVVCHFLHQAVFRSLPSLVCRRRARKDFLVDLRHPALLVSLHQLEVRPASTVILGASDLL